jgi:hypothetical protein
MFNLAATPPTPASGSDRCNSLNVSQFAGHIFHQRFNSLMIRSMVIHSAVYACHRAG